MNGVASRLTLLISLILAAVSLSLQKEKLIASVDICRLFPDGTKLRKPGTCSEGIVCQNFTTTPGVVCPKWYNLNSNKCDTKQPADRYCMSPCTKTSPAFVADTKTCNGWYQCYGAAEISKGICPRNYVFNQKLQSCSFADSTDCIATYEFCNVVPRNIAFQDEENCHKYFKCNVREALETIRCTTGTYYDRGNGKCVGKATVKCYKHPYPDNVCGDTKLAYRNRFVSDQATCRGYFYCQDLGVGKPDATPRWGQCSASEFFNPTEMACQPRSHVKCDEDRCDSRANGEMEISSTKGCQHYLLCGDGYTLKEEYCGDELYFNAENSVCTAVKKSYPSCS